MTTAILLGLLVGAGIALVLRGVFAPQPKLASLADGSYRTTLRANQEGLGAALRARLLLLLPPETYLQGDLASAMRITRTSAEKHVVSKFLTGVVAFFLPIVGWVVFTALEYDINVLLVFGASAVLSLVGFKFPDMAVRDQAKEKRDDFLAAFAAYLNLSAILVGASDGPESSLEKAANMGSGWVFAELRGAIEIARGDATIKHWDALGQLGEDIDVRELREFAAAMAATSTAASLPVTLRARAENLQNKVMSGIEGDAEAATDKMTVPMMLMVFALMIYVMYGALFSAFSTGGGSF